MGKYGLGQANDRGSQLLQFCAINNLVISNTLFRHSMNRRATWISPDYKTKNQIDYILIQDKWKNKVKNCRSYHSADIGSDHFLLLANLKFEPSKPKKFKKAQKRYDVEKLTTNADLVRQFKIQVGGAFEPLLNLETDNIEEIYSKFVEATNKTTAEVVGFRKRKQVDGLAPEVESACEQRRQMRIKVLKNPENKEARKQYKELNKRVKNEIKTQKNKLLEAKIEAMETDFKKNNSHNLFRSVRDLEAKSKKTLSAVKDKNGNTHTNKEKVLKCWQDHFCDHLNTAFPHQPSAITNIPEPPHDADSLTDISREEIKTAVSKMKSWKAPGIDAITAEVLKAGGEPMVDIMYKIFNMVWRLERTPKIWAQMLVTPIHKKGDKLDPANYRAIALLSIPGKVFSRILLDRMKSKTEEAITENQFGFRPNRGTVDPIFIVRQIIEKAREHQVPLHFNFVDFKAAFDTVWRKALWKMMLAIGVDAKIVRIIEALYDDTECAVVIDGQLTDWFCVKIGLRQGCLLSPTLFNIFLEFVMKELKDLNASLQLNNNLSIDIRYADDTTLLSTVFGKLSLSTSQLEAACKKWGMKINGAKCKIISPASDNITIDDQVVEKVKEFVFLGSVVPDCSADVKRRIALASSAFGRLRKTVWNNRIISKELKARLYKALILPIAIYASETWTLRYEDTCKLETFEMRCLRAILGVTLRDRTSNGKVRSSLQITNTITEVIKKKRLRWFGHVTRKPPEHLVYQAYRQDFQKTRPRGRPPKKWTTQIREDTGVPLATAERKASNRRGWRSAVQGGSAKAAVNR